MPPRALPSSSERLGVCGGRAGIPPGARGAYLRETPRVPTGDQGAYLRETPRVPTGDDFRSKSFLHKHFGIPDCKEDCTTDTTPRVVCGAHGLRQERSPAMVTHARVPVPQPSRPSPRTPLRILRTET